MAKQNPDKILLFCVLFLLALGSLMIFGISAPSSQETFGKTYVYLTHQLVRGIIPGIILGFFVFKINISYLKKFSLPLFLINLFLLLLVFVPQIGSEAGGAKRWLQIGPISFQPSEFLKITLFLYLAAWLEKKSKKDWQSFLTFLGILGTIALLLALQPDIGTLLLLLGISFLVYFIAETPMSHFFVMGALGITAFFFLIYTAPYRMQRFLTFLNPQLDPMGMGYQIKQAQITIGSGGILGKGFGMSAQKFGFLPYPKSDSIFAVLCEETGLLGSFILIVFFVIFLIRGVKISKEAKNSFSKLLAWAITLQIAFQALLNIGSMTGISPLTGIPLPFISFGGTHIIVELIGIGILLNIARE